MEYSDERDMSGVRQRTNRAILDAAIAAWARDFSTALGDIADAAGVSRSTLHRYFPDRQSLIDAALVDAIATLDRESAKALAGCTGAGEELESLIRVLVDHGELLIFLFSDPERFTGNPQWSETEDGGTLDLIKRAQADGTVADDLDPTWVLGVMYSICYVAAESIAVGTLSRHRAGDVAVRTLLTGVKAPASVSRP